MLNARSYGMGGVIGMLVIGLFLNVMIIGVGLLCLLGYYIYFYDGHENLRSFLSFILNLVVATLIVKFVLDDVIYNPTYEDTPILNIIGLCGALVMTCVLQWYFWSLKGLAYSIPAILCISVLILINNAAHDRMVNPTEKRQKLYSEQRWAKQKHRDYNYLLSKAYENYPEDRFSPEARRVRDNVHKTVSQLELCARDKTCDFADLVAAVKENKVAFP
ncbi:hypothetical protein K6U66_02445 [Vibrio alginolyticus]|uniref:hypothetical protein n=1 Tax=Vibrio alginolyticus TaxID=663 RepID=UPI001EECE6CB|nr:hypothetical protein [Vibrio alginolyticus]MCG6316655.1 hypothetical protein [Vibrio alginolyticus]